MAETLNNPLVVWAGDIHTNSTVGIAPPVIKLSDGVTANPSRLQRDLWQAWLDAWKQVKARKRSVVLVLGGEICDIDSKDRSHQMLTRDPEKAQVNAVAVLEPALGLASKVIVLRGTEAHSGKSAWTDESMARHIHKNYCPVIKNGSDFSWYEHDFSIGGRVFNLAHHTTMGRVARSERDAANHVSADLMMSYGRSRSPFPDYAMRGHVHRVSDSGMNFPIRTIICPAWEAQTSYIHRLAEGHKMPEIGIITVDPAKGEVDWIRYEYKREVPVLV